MMVIHEVKRIHKQLAKIFSTFAKVSVVVKDLTMGAGAHEFDYCAGQMGLTVTKAGPASTFIRSCVAQALSRGDRPRHSLHLRHDNAGILMISFCKFIGCELRSFLVFFFFNLVEDFALFVTAWVRRL